MPQDDPYRQAAPTTSAKSETPADISPGPPRITIVPGERTPPDSGAANPAAQRRARQQRTAVRELGRLWTSPHDPDGMDDAMTEFVRRLGWNRMGAIYDAVSPLPWSILRPLAALPAWTIYGGVSTPLTNRPDEAAHRIRQLPQELEEWRRLDTFLGGAWGLFYGIFERRCDEIRPGMSRPSRAPEPAPSCPRRPWEEIHPDKPEDFLCDLGDALEIPMRMVMERRSYLEELVAGTRPARLTGDGPKKSDGKAQNLARLREAAIALALRINRAILPRDRRDRRLLHGVLRTTVRRRMITIITLVYGVTFSDAEARDMLRKYVKESQKTRK